ncbi:MAG: hypothetical protein ACOX7J_02995 [Bacillota bacterium]|jgi:hypothetical protein
MAKVEITPVKLEQNGFGDLVWTAGTTDGFKIPMTAKDNKILMLFQNTGTSAATVTLKCGNGIQGVNDLAAYSIAASGITAIEPESGAFKNVSGEDKGYAVVVPSATAVKCAVVVLP